MEFLYITTVNGPGRGIINLVDQFIITVYKHSCGFEVKILKQHLKVNILEILKRQKVQI